MCAVLPVGPSVLRLSKDRGGDQQGRVSAPLIWLCCVGHLSVMALGENGVQLKVIDKRAI